MAYFSPRYYFKSQSKNKTRSKKKIDWAAAGLILAGALSFYTVLFPLAAGSWGRNLNKIFGWLAGVGRFALPLLVGLLGWDLLQKKDKQAGLLKKVFVGISAWFALILVSLLSQAVWKVNQGGVLGDLGQKFLVEIFGVVGAWMLVVAGLFVLALLLIGKSPGDVFHSVGDALREDWKNLRSTNKEPIVREKRPPVVPSAPTLAPLPPKAKEEPKIIGGSSEKSSVVKSVEGKTAKEKKPQIPVPAEVVAKNVQANGKVTELASKPQVAVPYTSPSLEIFESFGGGHPVSKEELTSRARLLEQTLANFNIAAAVVEIHPGPVITRYDLEPAPGVKVASISSRAADLALAMRSTGIRVLAPIPGKGAVGVEIPNLHPETVGLQELLAKPEFVNHKSPIAFVLGKTVSGEPSIVDLASLPHILIAGATGAGKSVAVHALISSILYRSSPDLVKFVLIDPKRLELPSYAMIPHLFDPCHSPMQAEVITNSKQAAKALGRLVKIMEYRYDLFSKANVRNIDSYNQKRKEQGLPPEFFLVVIIDELADLMITSPKEVEDSIQRLAQMARAVGIHLVLATQRPSVDVITGVIKANLPARIALRVASTIDSRVIIDTAGADVLLGKGDMLYLPPASPEPVRVQGAYVSEGEVNNLVNHVKQFGLPEYPDLFSSGSALEFAVEDKKEMRDLIEALKLVLERRRVSQDLLKAHFGSSARATNILSLLEVKEFIHKPEGSNRWDINFDMIEEFIAKVNNIPDDELMA